LLERNKTMTKRILVTAACLAWSLMAISTASSAHAIALTTQTGSYAACSASIENYFAQWQTDCGGTIGPIGPGGGGETAMFTNYKQNIRLASTSCSSGACVSSTNIVYTDFAYPVGRKIASYQGTLCSGQRKYELGTCAC
jgi:hypothetical protein